MVKIKPVTDIAKKFVDVTPGRAPYYESGVRSPDEDWKSETVAGKAAWEAGLDEARSKDMFAKKVTAAGTPKWQSKTLLKGVDQGRFRSGVAAAQADYETGFTPYHAEIGRIVLSKRGARGDPANLKRVEDIAKPLHAKRVGATAGATPA